MHAAHCAKTEDQQDSLIEQREPTEDNGVYENIPYCLRLVMDIRLEQVSTHLSNMPFCSLRRGRKMPKRSQTPPALQRQLLSAAPFNSKEALASWPSLTQPTLPVAFCQSPSDNTHLYPCTPSPYPSPTSYSSCAPPRAPLHPSCPSLLSL